MPVDSGQKSMPSHILILIHRLMFRLFPEEKSVGGGKGEMKEVCEGLHREEELRFSPYGFFLRRGVLVYGSVASDWY